MIKVVYMNNALDNNIDVNIIKSEKNFDTKSKLILLKNDRKIFEIKFKPTIDSVMGDVDIILNPAKKMAFENVVVGNEMYIFNNSMQVTSISWHGYFKKESEKILYPPIVHIKRNDQIIKKINSFASVDSIEPVPIPVCSLYIPKGFNLNSRGKVKKQDNNYYLDICKIKEDIRCDFFVFPKNISFEMFKSVPSFIMFIYADLEIYNEPNKGFNTINKFKNYLAQNIYGHDVLVRVVINPANINIESDNKKQIFQKYSTSYTLILNDANDVYNKIFDRPIISINDSGEIKADILKDLYEKQIGIKDNNDDFWNSLR